MALTVPSHESILRPETLAKQAAAQDAVKAELAAKAAEAKKVCLRYPPEMHWDRRLVFSEGRETSAYGARVAMLGQYEE